MIIRYSKIWVPTLAIGLIACTSSSEKNVPAAPSQKSMLSVKAVVAKSSAFDNKVVSTAEILPKEEVTLKAPLAGNILEIKFEEGGKVSKGQTLLRIDDRIWLAQRSGLQAELKNAQKDKERKEALIAVEGSTQEEVDLISTTIDKLEAQIQELNVNIDLAQVKAPFSGQVGMRDFSVGTYLPAGTDITTLTQLSDLKVDFSIPEIYSKSVVVGKKVDVLIGKDSLEAKIYAIDAHIDATSRTIKARASLISPKGLTIRPGAFAEVVVSVDHLDHAVLVPTESVVPEITDQTVFKYKNGKVVRQKVLLGNRTDENVHVLDGVAEGDTIITTGLLQVKDGMPVQIQSVQ